MKCLFVQSNEGKTGLKCVRRGWLNYPPCPMAVPPSTRPGLLVDIEAARGAMEGKGDRLAQPGQPRGFLCRSKTLLQLALGVQLIEALLLGPGERVKRDSRHTAFLVSVLFPTALSFLPTPRSIPKKRPAGKVLSQERLEVRAPKIGTTILYPYSGVRRPRGSCRSLAVDPRLGRPGLESVRDTGTHRPTEYPAGAVAATARSR
jgi:hypothetical protein